MGRRQILRTAYKERTLSRQNQRLNDELKDSMRDHIFGTERRLDIKFKVVLNLEEILDEIKG